MGYLKEKRYLQGSSKGRQIKIGVILRDVIPTGLLILVFGYVVWLVLLSNKNIFVLLERKAIRDTLQDKITLLKTEISKLQKRVEALRREDRFLIEKIAREELGMIKENEEIYVIIQENDQNEENRKKWIKKALSK